LILPVADFYGISRAVLSKSALFSSKGGLEIWPCVPDV